MGQLSAEARGQVRLAIENIYKKYPFPLREEVESHIERLCERKFQMDKRLSLKDLLFFNRVHEIRNIPIVINKMLGKGKTYYSYSEPTLKSFYNNNKNYNDYVIELRVLCLEYSRRNVMMIDMPLNVHLSGHFIGRIFERGDISGDLIEVTVSHIREAISYMNAIKLQNGLVNFTFPIFDGLALGELVDESDVSNREMKLVWDINGVRIFEEDLNALGPSSNILRIKTFINGDMLNSNQNTLYLKMKTVFSNKIIKKYISHTLSPDIPDFFIEEDEIIASKAIIDEIFLIEDWLKTCGSREINDYI
mgnify:CR=1 FL=1